IGFRRGCRRVGHPARQRGARGELRSPRAPRRPGRPQVQSSVVLVPPAGRSPAIFDLTMRNRPETLPPGKPQCCAESVTTLMSPRFGSSRPSNQALVDSDHSSSIVAGSSTNSTRPATESQLPASATLMLTCGFVRSALAWSPSRARKNQTSASSVTSCAVIGCARILPSANAVASITELLPRRILITSAWPSSFVAAPPAGLFPAPLGAWPPSVSSLAETPPDAEALPVDEPPDAVALSEEAAAVLAAPPPAVLATALPIPGALSTSSGSRVVPTAAPIPGATAASSASCVPLSESEPLSAAASSPAVLATALPIPGALSTSSGSPVVPTAAPIPGAAAASCFSG